MEIRRLDSRAADFAARFDRLLARAEQIDAALDAAVARILADVRARGDAALLDYTRRFDRLDLADGAALEIAPQRCRDALEALPAAQRAALTAAAERILAYHQRQKEASDRAQGERMAELIAGDGVAVGQRIAPLERVGLYVPGGTAGYPSSVLMNAIPPRVAGVEEIVMTTPMVDGAINELTLAAAALTGVDRLFALGGAQAAAALAYGTETVPRVDKIVGPGNRYVAAAKRMLFGVVGIDMVAGPSEIVILCDGATDPEWIALDLFAQAEHDEEARALLLSPDAAFLDAVERAVARLLPQMERAAIIRAALERHGALIRVRDLAEAVALANRIAPEHLELSVDDPERWAAGVRHAGAIFLGRHAAEALGDYCAGPNHVLPTAGAARFQSPLGVYDFQKRTSLIRCTAAGAAALAPTAAILARGEGLTAHARSAECRLPASKGTG